MRYLCLTSSSDGRSYVGCGAGFYGVYFVTDTLFPEPRDMLPKELAASVLTF